MITVLQKLTCVTNGIVGRRAFSLGKNCFQGLRSSYQPNNLEKRFLVWSGKYKSLAEVPDMVSHDVMERSRNKIRIRVANIMMVLTVVGCIVMVVSGKQASERGESVTKQNLDWHKRYNELHANEDKNGNEDVSEEDSEELWLI